MLNTNSLQAVGTDGVGLAVDVQRFGHDAFGAGYFVVYARHGKAAFFIHGFAVFLQNHRVNQHLQLVSAFGQVHHHHALVHVYLRGGQADAFCFVHGFGHVGHQLFDAPVHPFYRFGHQVQAGVGIAQNVQ